MSVVQVRFGYSRKARPERWKAIDKAFDLVKQFNDSHFIGYGDQFGRSGSILLMPGAECHCLETLLDKNIVNGPHGWRDPPFTNIHIVESNRDIMRNIKSLLHNWSVDYDRVHFYPQKLSDVELWKRHEFDFTVLDTWNCFQTIEPWIRNQLQYCLPTHARFAIMLNITAASRGAPYSKDIFGKLYGGLLDCFTREIFRKGRFECTLEQYNDTSTMLLVTLLWQRNGYVPVIDFGGLSPNDTCTDCKGSGKVITETVLGFTTCKGCACLHWNEDEID